MSEEIRNEIIEQKNTCFCQSKGFRKFLTTALGTFVGVFCALSLFAALHKPPMPPCPFAHGPMMRPCYHQMHHFDKHRGPRGEFHRKFEKKDFAQRTQLKKDVKN